MKKRLLSFFCWAMVPFLLAGEFRAVAEVAKLPPLKNPVLRRAPGLASWTILFHYKDEDNKGPEGGPAPGDRLRSVKVVKSGKMYWEQGTMTSGRKFDKWILDDIQIKTLPGAGEIAMLPKPDEDHPQPDYSDYSRSDFPELGWISLENYREVTTFEGQPAYFFEKIDAGEKGGRALLSEAHLPLSFSNKESTRTYVFNPPPSGPLEIPEKIAKMIETHKKGLEVLQRQPSPP